MKYLVLVVSIFFSGQLLADGDVKYIKNDGQWNDHVLFKAPIQSGELYLEKNRLTYSFYDAEKLHELHHLKHENTSFQPNSHTVEAYAFHVDFIGANSSAFVNGNDILSEYHNYFIGDNQESWKGNVPLFEQVRYQSIYKGIDLLFYSQSEYLKYDFIIKPNGNPASIQLDYQGAKINLVNESIHISLGFNTVIEQKPYAYQYVNGDKKQVACEYKLENNTVSFHFPEGYNETLELVIDPILVVATYTSSTQTGYGHSATYDNLGNIYTGGIFFGTGYPTTTGAFQIPYGGGGQDMGISKLNPDGSALIWATYIGGDQSDSPQSLVVNNSGELYIFGVSSSTDYPTSTNAFQTTMGGGWNDFVITHLTNDGASLLGSTFLGGMGDETLIGEIIVDDFGNAYVASSTSSTNFPTSASAFQSTWTGAGGGWATGVAFKLSPDMVNLHWSTYLNSDGTTGARGINLGPNESVYVVGTTEDGFFTTPGSSSATFLGGQDVFICQIDESGSNILASTYFGGTGFDTGIFLDIDIFGDVYITGTTDSNIPISTGCYGTANSGVFISKLNPSLSNVVWQTTIGDGSGWSNFTPNAFMVDVCRKIYVGGFGAGGSNLSTTADAFFDGSDWSEGYYMMSLEPNAASANFASYFQGDHVDGGTSRFDPNGIVYQAVCSPSTITPTAGAYSTCLTGSYDVAVFKIDFQSTSVVALAEAGPSTAGCTPFTVNFANNSTAINFIWDFDDGSAASIDQNPSYTFNDPGNYEVMLIAIDSATCNIADTFFIPISVSTPIVDFDFSFTNACEDSLVQFESLGASAADLFEWSFGDGETSSAMNPTHAYDASGTYNVELVVTSICGADDIISYPVQVMPPPIVDLGDDVLLCYGESLLLNAENPGCTYLWNDGSDESAYNVTESGTYGVTVSSAQCESYDEIDISVEDWFVDAGEDTTFCSEAFQPITLSASSGAAAYLWSTGETTESIEVSSEGTYQVDATTVNGCIYSDLVSIILNNLPQLNISASSREECNPGYISFTDLSTILDGEIIEWEWYFEGAENSTNIHPFTHWGTPGNFDIGLYVLTNKGCSDSILLNDYITINPAPQANFLTEPPMIDWCNPFLQFINTSTDYSRFIWDFGDSTSSQEISPYHQYEEANSYYVSLFVENDFDCKDSTAYTINPSNSIPFYVPNAFTPEKDGYNESFKAYSNCLRDYEMWIYSRWGELVFYTDDIEYGWDGNYQNKECQTGVYSWKIKYHGGKANQVKTGSVTLLR